MAEGGDSRIRTSLSNKQIPTDGVQNKLKPRYNKPSAEVTRLSAAGCGVEGQRGGFSPLLANFSLHFFNFSLPPPPTRTSAQSPPARGFLPSGGPAPGREGHRKEVGCFVVWFFSLKN